MFYKNTGSNNISNFVYNTNSFLQDGMIDHGSGSIPVFCDINGDGLQDMFVSNFFSYKDLAQKESLQQQWHYDLKLLVENYSKVKN